MTAGGACMRTREIRRVKEGPRASGVKSVFVDAELFLRYLTNEDPEKADRVEALQGRVAGGEIRLPTEPPSLKPFPSR